MAPLVEGMDGVWLVDKEKERSSELGRWRAQSTLVQQSAPSMPGELGAGVRWEEMDGQTDR